MSTGREARRSRLSPTQRALLERRLRGIALSAEAVRAERSAARPGSAPPPPGGGAGADTLDDLPAIRPPGHPPLVDDELWAALAACGCETARRLAAAPELAAEAAQEAHLDRLAVAAVGVALERLGVFQAAGERRSVAGLIRDRGIAPQFHKALRRWLEMLAEERLVERDGEEYVAAAPLPPPALAGLLDAEERRLYSEKLPAVLTGELHPLEFYLPGGSSASAEASYRELPVFRYCNGIAAAVVAAQVRALPPASAIRLLEVGAGTGGTTASLLPLLPPERTAYVYTDVSRFFTDLGRSRFAAWERLRYRELDLERHPRDQGFPASCCDWIVAAHVLHATRDLVETLGHLRWLLAAGGILLLLEETRFLRRYNFSMGFLPGFDHFEDYALRPLHPLLPSGRWGELLLAHGFAGVAACTEPGSPPERLGVDVLLARAR